MAKRKDDVSFSFTSKKAPEPVEPAAEETPGEAPADVPAEGGDPFASTDAAAEAPAADPYATETPADSYAASETPSETPTEEAPAEEPSAEPVAEATSEPEAAVEEAPVPQAAPMASQQKQFRILILADLSGRTNRGISTPGDVSSRKIRTVDTDNLGKVMAAVKPQLQLPVDEKSAIPLAFNALEDFRPDALLQQIPAFGNMLKLREQLKNPKTFKAAADAVRKLTGVAPKKAKPAAANAASDTSDFEKLLNQPLKSGPQKNPAQVSADALAASVVAGYSVPDADPDQATLVQLIEDALSAGLRAILRHPAFQGLESAWRGIEFLTSRLNTDDELKLAVLDISKDELYADLSGTPTIQKTGLFQLLVEQTRAPGVVPFSLVIGDYEFDQSPQNIALFAKIATLMHEAHVPFVAGATSKLAGWPSFAKFTDSGKWQPPADLALWEKLRNHKLSTHLGLAGPRFLLRMPYGPKTDAIDTYPFNEIPGAPVAENYLWANGAYAVALLIAQAFLENSWDGLADTGNDVSDLPCHMAVVDGDKEMTPCAQAFLSDRVADILRNLGIIPIVSVKNAAAVKVAGIHSIQKQKPLAAFWAST